MNEQMKTDLSQDLNKMLMEMYDKGFKDCETAALQAIKAGIRLAILSEREACAVLVEGGNHVHPKAPDAIWAKTVAKLIRSRGDK